MQGVAFVLRNKSSRSLAGASFFSFGFTDSSVTEIKLIYLHTCHDNSCIYETENMKPHKRQDHKSCIKLPMSWKLMIAF